MSWWSKYFRKSRHRGCIPECCICNVPMMNPEDTRPFDSMGTSLIKQYPDAPYGLGSIHFQLAYKGWVYTGKGDKFDKTVPVCHMCYLTELKKLIEERIADHRKNRARNAYDMQLDAEIYCDAWGITREEFDHVARCRGDDEEMNK